MGRIKAIKKSCGDALASVRVFMKRSFAGIPGWCWTVLVVGVILLIISLWGWLQGEENQESPSDTLRNVMLFLTPPVALWLAIRRIMVADKQADAAQKSLQNERYQRSAEMLFSSTLATQIGGIYALERLAREHCREHHIQIMNLLCTFVRHPNIGANDAENATQSQREMHRLASYVQAALTVIGRRNEEQRELEKEEKWKIDLSHLHIGSTSLAGAHLEGAFLVSTHLDSANLAGTHFEEAILIDANLEKAFLMGTHLEDAKLMGAHLERTFLWNTHLERANLEGANLESARFLGVKGLTQAMLDSAEHFGPDGKPLLGPDLKGTCCAESGEPLVWRYPSDSSPAPSGDDKLNPSST